MFFYLSKILWPLLQPLYHMAIALFVTCIASMTGWRKTAIVSSIYAVLIMLLFGMGPVGYNLLVYLERQYERPVLANDMVPHGIVVLGGSFEEDLTAHYGRVMAGGAMERMTTFMVLARRYQDMPTKLVFSGGSAKIGQTTEDNIKAGGFFTDADAAALFFLEQGFPLERITFEPKSRNTFENIAFSEDLLKPHHSEEWILITSAYHLPRAMNVAQQQGWPIIAYPVDYRTDGQYRYGLNWHIRQNFYFTHLAIHEWAGNAIYYLTGKSASILP